MGAALALLSSVSWGIADFFGGKTSRVMHPFAVFAWSQVIGIVFMGAIVFVTGAWHADPVFWPWSILGAICGTAGMTLFYSAMATGKIGIVSPIVSLAVIVPLAAGLIRGEMPHGIQVLGIISAVGGVVLASGPELTGAASPKPVLLAIASAFVLGFMFITISEGSKIDPIMSTFGIRVATTVIVLGVFAMTRTLGGISKSTVLPIIVVGVLDVAANVLFGIASTMGMLSVLSVLGSLYPIVTVLMAWWFLHERLKLVQYFGIAFALLGVVLISSGGI